MSGSQNARAIKDIASRRIYQPYFKARWQNMQNIVNDEVFFSLIKEPYLSYYQAYIRQWLQWATGYVPMLHRQDFFSTGMGYTVCDIFTRECMSGGYRLDSKSGALRNKLEQWAAEDLNNVLNRMFFYANAGGNAILCLTPINGEVYPSVLPINRVTFQIGRHGEITQAMLLNRFTAGSKAYYSREIRMMMDGLSFYCVQLCASNGTAVSPSWSELQEKNVPLELQSQWEYAYGNIQPNQWYKLPFSSLGLYNVRNKSVAAAITDLPGYSDSSLHTALDILYSIDYNYTQQQLDQYWGKTRVIIPKRMQNVAVSASQTVRVGKGVSFVESIEAPLQDEVYSEAPASNTINGDPIKPLFIQPDLRGEAHKYIRDADLELLASKVGLSSSTLANHLSYNNSKTATEVTAEQDTTETSVNNKRTLADKAINAMLKDVAAFYGFADDAVINWNRSGINTSKENENLRADYQAGLLPRKEYLRKRWRDLSEEEINKWDMMLANEERISPFALKESEDDYFQEPERTQ